MKKVSKLHLSTETLRRLTANDLAGMAGAKAASYNTHPCSNQSLIMAPVGCYRPATNEPDGSCNTWIGCDHQTDDPACKPVNPA
jgi:hypothetical protein